MMIRLATREARQRLLKRLEMGEATSETLRNDLASRCQAKAIRQAVSWAHRGGYIEPVRREGKGQVWRLTNVGKEVVR